MPRDVTITCDDKGSVLLSTGYARGNRHRRKQEGPSTRHAYRRTGIERARLRKQLGDLHDRPKQRDGTGTDQHDLVPARTRAQHTFVGGDRCDVDLNHLVEVLQHRHVAPDPLAKLAVSVDVDDPAVEAGNRHVPLEVAGRAVACPSSYQRFPELTIGQGVQVAEPAPADTPVDPEPSRIYELHPVVSGKRVEKVRQLTEGLEVTREKPVETVAQELVAGSIGIVLEP